MSEAEIARAAEDRLDEVVISYARPSAAWALAAAAALRSAGHSVWYDEALPAHGLFGEVIEAKVLAAKAVLVLWSEEAVKSPWVRGEAELALKAGKLVQLSLDQVLPPLPFNQIQCVRLNGAANLVETPAWGKILDSVRALIAHGEAASAAVRAPPPPVTAKPSIAVLPFSNLTGDAAEDYFADGMVEEIANALSRIKSIFVIAPRSSRALKQADLDHAGAAEALGVRYLLEGSVRKAGGRVRISVGLIDTDVGARIWSERFEDTFEDVFALQDRVSLAVAGMLEPAVRTAETQRALRRPAQTLGSYDLYLRAFSLYQSLRADDVRAALALAADAIALDPHNASALSLAANCHGQAIILRLSDDLDAHRREGRELARRALQVAPDDPEVAARVVEALFNLGESLRTLLPLAERAVALNPGSAHARNILGWTLVMLGDTSRGTEDLSLAMRLDPISADRALHLSGLAAAALSERRFEAAIDLARQSSHLSPFWISNQMLLASCYGHLGQLGPAQEALVRFHVLSPDVDVLVWARLFRDPQKRQVALDGLARAGAGAAAVSSAQPG